MHSPYQMDFRNFLAEYSIEVTPKTYALTGSLGDWPGLSRVYVGHIVGTPIEAMLETTRHLFRAGLDVVPHIPARFITNTEMLAAWLSAYREIGVDQALVIAGGAKRPQGSFANSLDLLRTGLFEKMGFRRLYFAGHPEGSLDIDPKGGDQNARAALLWKSQFLKERALDGGIVTQFLFKPKSVIDWAARISDYGVDLPIYVGIAGPARIETLIKYALLCGVGPSLDVLSKRAKDFSKLFLPYEPFDFLTSLARHKAENPKTLIQGAHFFPFGGVKETLNYINDRRNDDPHHS